MIDHLFRAVLIVGLALFQAGVAAAQRDEVLFLRLQSGIGAALARPDVGSAQRSHLEAIGNTAMDLQQTLRTAQAMSREPVPGEYVRLLEAYASLVQPGGTVTVDTVTLREASDDLRAAMDRIRSSSNSMALTSVPRLLVHLRVVTVRAGAEVGNWNVSASPRWLLGAGQDPLFRFPQPTSPSRYAVPPGRFRLVVSHPSGATRSFDADLDLQDRDQELEIRIEVP